MDSRNQGTTNRIRCFEMRKPKLKKFPSGAIRTGEDGKADYVDTISWTAMERYAQYMTGKKKMVGKGNFKHGVPIPYYERAAVRHWQKYLINKYERGNIETNVDHLAAMLFNIIGIIHEEEMAKLKKSKRRK